MMRPILRKLCCYTGATNALVLLVLAPWVFTPARGDRFIAITWTAIALAFAFWQARNETSRVFLRTRPGWPSFWRSTWMTSLVVIFVLSGGIVLARSLDVDRIFWEKTIGGIGWREAQLSLHPNLLAYFGVVHVAFRLLLCGRVSWGIALALLSVFIPSMPDLHGRAEHYLWPSPQPWLRGVWLSVVVLLFGHPFWRKLLPKGRGGWSSAGGILRWLMSADLADKSAAHVAVCTAFAVWLVVLVAAIPASVSSWNTVALLCGWGIFQFFAALDVIRSQPYYLSRPRKSGGGGIGGMRTVLSGAYNRTVFMALLVSVILTWRDAVPGLSLFLMIGHAVFPAAAASCAFLAMVLTWWLVNREKETPLLACGLYALLVIGPGLFAARFRTSSPYTWLLVILAANIVLLTVWQSVKRISPQAGHSAFRVLWLLAFAVFAAGFLWCVDREFCMGAVEVLWRGFRRGGYALAIWLSLTAAGLVLTSIEGRMTRRPWPAVLFGLALSMVIPFSGLLWLHMTRTRMSWHKLSRWRIGLLPRLLGPAAMASIMFFLGGESWWADTVSEAYLESPFRHLLPRLWLRPAPVVWIAVFPAPDRLTFGGIEIPNPWRMSRREAVERLQDFLVRRREGISFDSEAFMNAVALAPAASPGNPYEFRFHMPPGTEWNSEFSSIFPPTGGAPDPQLEVKKKEIETILMGADDSSVGSALDRTFGGNALGWFSRYLQDLYWRPGREDPFLLNERRPLRERILETIDSMAQREGIHLPEVAEIRAYGRLLACELPPGQGLPWPLLVWNAMLRMERMPREFLSCLISELEGCYVVGQDPPVEVSMVLLLATDWRVDFRPLVPAGDLERFFAAMWASSHMRDSGSRGSLDLDQIMRYPSRRQKEFLVGVLDDVEIRFFGVLPMLAETGRECLRTHIEFHLKHFGLPGFGMTATDALLAWPDASILDTLESNWKIIIGGIESADRVSRRITVKQLHRLIEGLAAKWPDDPRVRTWRGEATALAEE